MNIYQMGVYVTIYKYIYVYIMHYNYTKFKNTENNHIKAAIGSTVRPCKVKV
jgi:hypothetical protein